MHQKNERIRELLEASIQIAEHMNESGNTGSQIEQMKQMLRQQLNSVSGGNGQFGQNAQGLSAAMAQIEQMAEELQQHEWQAYSAETEGHPAQFESLSFEDQLGQTQAYHEKIDYKSLKKIKQNLEQIRSKTNE